MKLKKIIEEYNKKVAYIEEKKEKLKLWERNYIWCKRTIPTMEKIVVEQNKVLKNLHKEIKYDDYQICVDLYKAINSNNIALTATRSVSTTKTTTRQVPHEETNWTYLGGPIWVPTTETTYTSETKTTTETENVPDYSKREQAKKNLEYLKKLQAQAKHYKENIDLYIKIENQNYNIGRIVKRLQKCQNRQTKSENSINALFKELNKAVNEANAIYDTLKATYRKFDKLGLKQMTMPKAFDMNATFEPFDKEKVRNDWKSGDCFNREDAKINDRYFDRTDVHGNGCFFSLDTDDFFVDNITF